MKIRKEDTVIVIAGNDKGSKGRVLKVLPKTNRVIVEGINVRKRHTKPNQMNPQGGIIEKEMPVHISNVMVVDPKTGEPTRIGKKIVVGKNDKKQSVRISRRSGEEL